MTLIEAIEVLAKSAPIFNTAINLLRGGNKPAQEAVAKLPQGVSAEEINKTILRASDGGSLIVRAGDNNGGHLAIEGTNVAAGDGVNGGNGGSLTMRAGDGGLHGPGGNLVIRGGTFRGGNGG